MKIKNNFTLRKVANDSFIPSCDTIQDLICVEIPRSIVFRILSTVLLFILYFYTFIQECMTLTIFPVLLFFDKCGKACLQSAKEQSVCFVFSS